MLKKIYSCLRKTQKFKKPVFWIQRDNQKSIINVQNNCHRNQFEAFYMILVGIIYIKEILI